MTYLATAKTLYLLRQDVSIKASPTKIIWKAPDQKPESHPIEGVRDIVAHYKASLDGSLFRLVSEHHIPVGVIDGRFEFLCHITPPFDGAGNLRLLQYAISSDASRRLEIARAIVRGKTVNQAALLKEYDLAVMPPAISDDASLETLLGTEGAFARAYFGAWPRLLEGTGFAFDARRKHPASDPVNALYDFLVSQLANEIFTFCLIVGLDPYIGVYHVEVSNRPSLVADLVEEWRAPIVDKFILRSLRRKEFSPEDFVTKDGSCRLASSAWGKVITKWQVWYVRDVREENTYRDLTFRDMVERQVRHFARVCRGDDSSYEPYHMIR